MAERIGRQTLRLTQAVHAVSWAAAGGRKEGEGPLKKGFDLLSEDSYLEQESWEKAESQMMRQCLGICLGKAELPMRRPELLLGGDCSISASAPPLPSRTRPSPISGSTGPARPWRRV